MLKVLCRLNHSSYIKLSTSAKAVMSLVEDLKIVTGENFKRLQQDDNENVSAAKKVCSETDRVNYDFDRTKKKKIAMLVVYSGQGYLGLQRNPGRKTIEEELMVALLQSKLITEEVFNQPQLIQFQRAARTDKGVSAIRQILSMKLSEKADVKDINIHLPPQIRAVAIRRVTKGFNCKSACDARTYSYMLPTFAFAPHSQNIDESYRVPLETITKVNEILSLYLGTHNYHNFTSRKLPLDPSAVRYMLSLNCDKPFVMGDMEFAVIKIKGQSFMLHQIRKMVGLMICIIRGLTTTDTITRAWDVEKLDLPVAPGLGLLLEEVHYDRYNSRYGSDGIHEPLEWSSYEKEIENFKKEHILPTIVEAEKEEKSMLLWLETLYKHSFDVRREHTTDVADELDIDGDKAKTENHSKTVESAESSSKEICSTSKEDSKLLDSNSACNKEEIKNTV